MLLYTDRVAVASEQEVAVMALNVRSTLNNYLESVGVGQFGALDAVDAQNLARKVSCELRKRDEAVRAKWAKAHTSTSKDDHKSAAIGQGGTTAHTWHGARVTVRGGNVLTVGAATVKGKQSIGGGASIETSSQASVLLEIREGLHGLNDNIAELCLETRGLKRKIEEMVTKKELTECLENFDKRVDMKIAFARQEHEHSMRQLQKRLESVENQTGLKVHDEGTDALIGTLSDTEEDLSGY